jgi:hypothetical protein
MGISLNGLTPANTYQSLIKVGDNSQLTATLKTLSDGFGTDLPMQVSTSGVNFTGTLTQNGLPISTTPSGVAGAIQFSDGSAFSSDAANLFWDDTNNRLGVGTNNPYAATFHVKGVNTSVGSNAVFVENSIGLPALIVRNNGTVNLPGNLFAEADITVGNGNTSLSARLGIKGSGSTSATTSLLVQNSAGTEVLKVTDDSVTNARGTLNVLHPSSATRSLKLNWGSIFATDSASELILGAVFTVPSSPQILLAGNARGSGANTMQLQASAGVSIATSVINPSAQLHVKGSGNTSATTSLLVQNSAGAETFKVQDNGVVVIENFTFVSGSVIENTTTRLVATTGGVAVNSNYAFANSSSILDVASTTKGFLPPRMTTTQKNAISSPASGLMVYDTDTNKLCCYNGTSWNDLF